MDVQKALKNIRFESFKRVGLKSKSDAPKRISLEQLTLNDPPESPEDHDFNSPRFPLIFNQKS